MTDYHIPLALISLAVSIAIICLSIRQYLHAKHGKQTPVSIGTCAWGISFAILPAAFGVFALLGFYRGHPAAPAILDLTALICAVVVLKRENGKALWRSLFDFLRSHLRSHAQSTTDDADKDTGSDNAEAPWLKRQAAALRGHHKSHICKLEAKAPVSRSARFALWIRNQFFPWIRSDFARLAFAAFLTNISLEICWHVNLIWMNTVSCIINWGIVVLAMLVLYFLFQRRSWGASAIAIALYVVGIIEYYVVVLKGSTIQPGDIYAIGTATAVMGGLSLNFGGTVVIGGAALDLALSALARINPQANPVSRVQDAKQSQDQHSQRVAGADAPETPEKSPETLTAAPAHKKVPQVLISLLLAVVCGLGSWGVTRGAYAWTQYLGTKFWQPVVAYSGHGFLTSFFSMWYGMPIVKPKGYSETSARSIEKKLAASYDASDAAKTHEAAKSQFKQVKPTIIVVQNETFSDLSKFYDLGYTGYKGPAYFNSISDAIVRGTLDVSVVGGGTCNSEFELLTGNSMAYIGGGKYPYNLYDFSKVNSLAKQLKAEGYATAAIHPNLASNWNRDKVYPDLGFDQFLDINSFRGAPVFHNGATDLSTYNRALELIRSSDKPMFIMDVTMQNHTGYDTHNIPYDDLTHYQLSGVSEYENDEFNEYVSCIEASDRDLKTFMDELRELDKPVILVFYGDHQPNISSNYLNNAVYPNEDPNSLEHQLRTYKTQYFIWANYDIVGTTHTSQERETSISYLGAELMELAGGPLSDHEKASLASSVDMPELTLMGYSDVNGTWHETSTDLTEPCVSGDSAAAKAYRELDMVQYLEFASKVRH